jgi:hypothetical protein
MLQSHALGGTAEITRGTHPSTELADAGEAKPGPRMPMLDDSRGAAITSREWRWHQASPCQGWPYGCILIMRYTAFPPRGRVDLQKGIGHEEGSGCGPRAGARHALCDGSRRARPVFLRLQCRCAGRTRPSSRDSATRVCDATGGRCPISIGRRPRTRHRAAAGVGTGTMDLVGVGMAVASRTVD